MVVIVMIRDHTIFFFSPKLLLTLEGLCGGGVLSEETAGESTVGGDTSTSSHPDEVHLRSGLREEHHLTGRASEGHAITGLSIAQVVRAHTLLGRILLASLGVHVHSTAHAERTGLAGKVITVPIGGIKD